MSILYCELYTRKKGEVLTYALVQYCHSLQKYPSHFVLAPVVVTLCYCGTQLHHDDDMSVQLKQILL